MLWVVHLLLLLQRRRLARHAYTKGRGRGGGELGELVGWGGEVHSRKQRGRRGGGGHA